MRKKYKNILFRILQESKLGVDSFEVEEVELLELPAISINFKNTPFKFIIRNTTDDFDLFDYQYVKYNPKYNLSEFYPETGWTSFDAIAEALLRWLNMHIYEYLADKAEPDLWEEYKSGNKSMNIDNIDFDEQGNFSIDERAQIKLSLNELKLLIEKNISMNEKEKEIVNNRLDYLIDASNRLNKFDWKSLSVSTLISITLSLSLDTSKGHLLFELFKKVFSMVPLLNP